MSLETLLQAHLVPPYVEEGAEGDEDEENEEEGVKAANDSMVEPVGESFRLLFRREGSAFDEEMIAKYEDSSTETTSSSTNCRKAEKLQVPMAVATPIREPFWGPASEKEEEDDESAGPAPIEAVIITPESAPKFVPCANTSATNSHCNRTPGIRRPEFIFASTPLTQPITVNDDNTTIMGLTFTTDRQGSVVVSSVSPDSPFAGSGILDGDAVIALLGFHLTSHRRMTCSRDPLIG